MNTLRLFTPSVFRSFPVDFFDRLTRNTFNENSSTDPLTNILEDKDSFQIEVALPGYSKEQISMNYLNNLLTIESNLQENGTQERNYLSQEFGRQDFSKEFIIPRMLDGEKISAEFTNGILRITIPKREEAKVKEPIQVQIQ